VADVGDLVKARSLLVILQATCQQTLLALEGLENAVGAQLADDLRAMIERTGTELAALAEKIESEPAP
jgi:hypothetical protein